MKKQIITITLSALLCAPSIQSSSEGIKIDSELLNNFDGSSIGITGEVIARIKKYQSRIITILLGAWDHETGKRKGRYEFDGNVFSVQELAHIESTTQKKSDAQASLFLECLRTMRHDFESISLEFRPVIHGAKNIMSALIVKSCENRHREDSLLYIWAQTREENELELFDRNLKSIKDFEIFIIDLYNFLEDLCVSCPKAFKQFSDMKEKYRVEHAEKVKRVKELLAKCAVKPVNESAFFGAIAQTLDKMAAHDISHQKVTALINAFNKNHGG